MASCCICLDEPINVMLVGCNHACCCQTCADNLLLQVNSKCPICRVELVANATGKFYERFFLSGNHEASSSYSELDSILQKKYAELDALNQKIKTVSSQVEVIPPVKATMPVEAKMPLNTIRVRPDIVLRSPSSSALDEISLENWTIDSENFHFRPSSSINNYGRRVEILYNYKALHLSLPALRAPFGLARELNLSGLIIDKLDVMVAFDANQMLLTKMQAFEALIVDYLYMNPPRTFKKDMTLEHFKSDFFKSMLRIPTGIVDGALMNLRFKVHKNKHGIITHTTTQVFKNNLSVDVVNKNTIVGGDKIKCVISPYIWMAHHGCGISWTIQKIEISR